VDIGTGSVVELRHPAPDVPANTSAKAGPRVPAGSNKPKVAPTVGANPPAAVTTPSSAPAAIAPPAPQLSTKADPNSPNGSPGGPQASKADDGAESCPKGATPEHPVGCYLNGTWRVDVGDGRGYQQPPGSSGSATANPNGPAKGMTGTSVQQDPKTAAASGPIV